MLQRIQSLYLVLVVVLGTLLCFFAPIEFIQSGSVEPLPLMSWSRWPLAVLSVAIPLLALVDVFLFRHRILQTRLNVVNVLLCLGYYALLALYVFYILHSYEPVADQLLTDAQWYPTLWAAVPMVNVVLLMMSIRRILHDEALVRAADRLR